MYPTLVRIGEFEITAFGLIMFLAFLAFLAASAVLAKSLRRNGLDGVTAQAEVGIAMGTGSDVGRDRRSV